MSGLDAVGESLVVIVHLLLCQGIVGGEGGYDHVGSGACERLSLCQLLGEAVACEAGIYEHTTLGSHDGGPHEQDAVGGRHAVALSGGAHQKGRNTIGSEKFDDSTYCSYVKISFFGDGCDHRHDHTAVLTILHDYIRL